MSEISGTLKKAGARGPKLASGGWKDRFCTADGTVFKYFKPGAKVPQGQFFIKDILDVFVQSFEKVPVNCGFDIEVLGRTYNFYAESAEEAKRWIDALNTFRGAPGGLNTHKRSGTLETLDTSRTSGSTKSEPPSQQNMAGKQDRLRSRSSALGSGRKRPSIPTTDAKSKTSEELDDSVNIASLSNAPTNEAGVIDRTRARSSAMGATSRRPAPSDLEKSVAESSVRNSTVEAALSNSNEAGEIDRGRSRSSAVGVKKRPMSAAAAAARAAAANTESDMSSNEASVIDRSRARFSQLSSRPAGDRSSVMSDFDAFSDGTGAVEADSGGMRTRTGTIAQYDEFFQALEDDDGDDDDDVDESGPNREPHEDDNIRDDTNSVHTDEQVDGEVRLRPKKESTKVAAPPVADDGVVLTFWANGKKTEAAFAGFGTTVADLRTYLVNKGLEEENPEFWEVSHIGVDRLLDDDDSPLGKQIVMIEPTFRFLVLFLPDEREFVLLRVSWDISAKEVCEHKRLRKHLRGIDEPALFLRENYVDQMFAPDDTPLDALYYPSENGAPRVRKAQGARTKLILKPRHIKRISVADIGDLAPDTNPIFNDSDDMARGMLWKQGDDKLGRWQRRYFVLKDGWFTYYKNQEDKGAALNEVRTSSFEDVEVMPEDASERKCRFQLRTNLNGRGAFNLAADNFEQMNYWVKRLRLAVIRPKKTGFLLKQGAGSGSKFRSRWFELRGTDLLYFDEVDQADGETYSARQQKGTISLADATDIEKSVDNEEQFSITVQNASKKHHRVFELKAKTTAEMDSWVSAIMSARREGLHYQTSSDDMPEFSTFVEEVPFVDSRNFGEPTMVSPPRSPEYERRFNSGSSKNSKQSSALPISEVRKPPAPLPEPIFPVEEAVKDSDGFVFVDGPDPYADEDWEKATEPVKIADPLLEIIHSPSDPLNRMMGLTPVYRGTKSLHEHAERAHEELIEDGTGAVVNNNIPDGLLSALKTRDAPEPDIDTVLEIDSPAVLKTLVIDASEQMRSAQKISLSGVILIQRPNGTWSLSTGSRFHDPLDSKDGMQNLEFKIRGQIRAVYLESTGEWNVTSIQDTSSTNHHRFKTWLQRGGHTPIQRIQVATESLIAIYNEPLSRLTSTTSGASSMHGITSQNDRHSVESARRRLLDDSRTESTGVLVRRDFCSAIANILQHGMNPTYWGGFYTTTLWTIVSAACPKPSASSSASGRAAYRVYRDLDTNPNMGGDHNIKFRTFICAALNHHFLRDWLRDLYLSLELKNKYYAPGSFLRTCPPEMFGELLLALEPLMTMPFRLFSSFELRRQSTSRRQRSQTRIQRTATHAQGRVRSASGHLDRTMTVKGFREEHNQSEKMSVAIARYDNLQPEDLQELPFRQGDELQILTYENDEWLVCRSETGEGLVPVNYVEIMA